MWPCNGSFEPKVRHLLQRAEKNLTKFARDEEAEEGPRCQRSALRSGQKVAGWGWPRLKPYQLNATQMTMERGPVSAPTDGHPTRQPHHRRASWRVAPPIMTIIG